MNLKSRLDSLKNRHGLIDGQITAEDQRPKPDGQILAKLKLEKLRIKEEMERIRTTQPGTAQAGSTQPAHA